ncbi:MAG: hypothetical protein KDE51_09465 [Anaerolineales bacterium]|nr:hypothetical protein [Anaerolineales bacterium]
MDDKNKTHEYQIMPNSGHYRAYVLRCWGEPTAGQTVWRFSLEGANRPRQGFATLEVLVHFLRAELQIDPTEDAL